MLGFLKKKNYKDPTACIYKRQGAIKFMLLKAVKAAVLLKKQQQSSAETMFTYLFNK